jgi:HD superfamily phosphodiesterase
MSVARGDKQMMSQRERVAAAATGVSASVVAVLLASFALADADTTSPPWLGVALLASLGVLAENSSVLLPTKASASPGLMIVLTAATAFAERGAIAAVLGTALVAGIGGFPIIEWRKRAFGVAGFNCGQHGLAGAAAAAVFCIAGPDTALETLLVGVLATIAFAVVNLGMVVSWQSQRHGVPSREVWADFLPLLPGFATFGSLGVLLGQLFSSLGALVVPLVVVPAAIARSSFRAHLELRESHEAALQVFVRAIEAKDRYTAGHCERVAKFSGYMGEELGFSLVQLQQLRYAAYLHDVGKLAVPSSLLNKPGRLTEHEYEQVRKHNDAAIEILSKVAFLRVTIPVAADKYARFDGDPSKADLPALQAHVVAVADAFDAMTSTRSYRKALSQDVAIVELRDKAGTQFNPRCVEALVRALDARGECYGAGHETDAHDFEIEPPDVGVGSAGLDYPRKQASGT